MTQIHDWIAAASAWWWPKLADHLWQATLFAVVVLLASLLIRRGSARFRHTLWLLASAKFIVPVAFLSFLSSVIGLDSLWILLTKRGSGTDVMLRGIAEPVTSLTNNYELTVNAIYGSDNELYCWLTAIWLAGCALLIVSWSLGRRKCRRTLNQSQLLQTGREWLALERARSLLGMRREVRLMLSPQQVEPGVFNIWKPVILLPASIADHLDDEELLAIMLHELVHVQRRDNLTGRLQLAMTGLFWFHPLVWFISRKLFDEREQACDERVLEIYGTPETYAASILKVVRFSFGWNVAGVTGAGSGSNLRRRIDNIMAMANGRRSAGIMVRIVISAGLGIALVAIVAAASHKGRLTDSAQRIDSQKLGNGFASVDSSVVQKTRETQDRIPPPPPQAPQDEAPAQPPAPADPVQPVNPAAPVNPTQPVNPVTRVSSAIPSQPPSPPQPPSHKQPPAPPAKPASEQEKSEKPRGDKKEVQKGELIEAPRPIYPDEAKAKKIEGQVTVSIVIGEEGNVISARPTSGPELLQGAAKDAALKARFKPTVVNGKPAKVAGAMTYNFVLDEKEKD